MKCDICNKEYKNIHGLNIHLCKIHNINKNIRALNNKKDNNIQCQICNKLCKDLKGLSTHIGKKHSDISRKLYYDIYLKKENEDGLCKICKKEIVNVSFTLGYAKHCSNKCSRNDPDIMNIVSEKVKLKHGDLKFKEEHKNRIKISYQLHPEYRQKSRERNIKRMELQKFNGEKLVPSIGNLERDCLNILESNIEYKIIKNEQTIGFFPDGKISELNIILEFDEYHHFRFDGSYTIRDQKRQKELEDKGWKFFRIKQKDWEKDRDNIINDFKIFLTERGLECQKI